MNKKLIIGLVASLLLSSSVFASQGKSCNSSELKSNSCKESKKCCNKSKGHYGKKHKFVSKVMRLDLSDKQKKEIKDIVKNCKKNMPNPKDAFTDSSFDKEMFIKLAKEKKESKIERKAKMIEKVYAVLNSAQKKELKSILDKKGHMKKAKTCNSKSCKD